MKIFTILFFGVLAIARTNAEVDCDNIFDVTDGDGNVIKKGCRIPTSLSAAEAEQACVDKGMDRLYVVRNQDYLDSLVNYLLTQFPDPGSGIIKLVNGVLDADGNWYVYDPNQSPLFSGVVPSGGNTGDVLKLTGNGNGGFDPQAYEPSTESHIICEFPAPSTCTLEDSVENEICDLLTAIELLQETDESFVSRISNIEYNYQTVEAEISNLNQDVQNLQQDVTTLQEKSDVYEQQAQTFENEIEELKAETDLLEARDDAQDSRLDYLEEQAQNLTECVETLKNETAELSAENQEQDNKLDALVQEIEDLKKEDQKLKEKNQEQDDKIKELEEENENLKCLLAELQGKVAKIEEFFYPGGQIFIRSGGTKIVSY